MKFTSTLAVVGLTLALGAGNAHAVNFATGDVFAAVGNGQVQHYSSAGTLLETLNTTRGGFTTGMTFDGSGRLYVTNFSDASVSRFNNNGTLANAVWANTGAQGGGGTESILQNAAGDFYVGNAGGNTDIQKFNAAGVYQASYNSITSRGSDWIDLAADQKTMFYTTETGQIKRFDVSTNAQLADFASSNHAPKYAFRLLAGGGLIVSATDIIERYDAAGNVIQTYNNRCGGCFALNLNGDGKSFWAGDFTNGLLTKFDIVTGTILQTINTGSGSLFGVTVFGEIAQGCGTNCGGGGHNVPEPSSMLLLGSGILAMGMQRLRRQ